MPTHLNNEKLTQFTFKTLNVAQEKAWQNNHKGRLEQLLSINGIDQFFYRNYILQNNVRYFVTIIAQNNNGQWVYNLYLQQDPSAPENKREDFFSISSGENPASIDLRPKDKPVNINNNQVLNNSSGFLNIRAGNGAWQTFDRNIDAGFVTQDLASVRGRNEPIGIEYKQVYDELTEAISVEHRKLQKQASAQYQEAKKAIEERLKNAMYNDVRMSIKLSQEGSKLSETLSNSGDTTDIQLDITLSADGSIKIKHHLAEDYLKKQVPKWQDEANKRGLEVEVEDLRKEVTDYFTSKELEQSMANRFLSYLHEKIGIGIGRYVEAVQASQKVAQHIWEEGTINESLWHSNNPEYQKWPTYIRPAPVVGGAIDGVIDEIIGLPMAVKSIYGIATDSKQREGLLKMFSSEGIKQLYQGLKESVDEKLNDEEKQGHFIGQTSVSTISMMSGMGLITKTGKIGDVAQIAANGAGEIGDIKVLKALDNAKKPKDKALRNVADEMAMKEFVDEAGYDFVREHADEVNDIAKIDNVSPTAEIWKKRRERGQKYNKKVQDLEPNPYQFHEVTIEHPSLKYTSGPNKGKPQRFRVDSYTHELVIVERKATDFDKIQLKTFEGYLLSIKRKYPTGAKIVAREPEINGKLLQGKIKIQVPTFNKNSKKLKEFQDLVAKEKYQIEIIFIDE